jgi:hypothetical protein
MMKMFDFYSMTVFFTFADQHKQRELFEDTLTERLEQMEHDGSYKKMLDPIYSLAKF